MWHGADGCFGYGFDRHVCTVAVMFDTIVFQQQQQRETKKKCAPRIRDLFENHIEMKMKMKNRNVEIKTAALSPSPSLSMFWIFYLHNAPGLCVCFIFTHCTHLITYESPHIHFVIVVITVRGGICCYRLAENFQIVSHTKILSHFIK